MTLFQFLIKKYDQYFVLIKFILAILYKRSRLAQLVRAFDC